jgi:hypothetical protein
MSSSSEDDAADSDSSFSSIDSDAVQTVAVLAPYLRSYYVKEPRTTSILQGAQYYMELVGSDNELRFYDMARMRRETFYSLLRVLETTGRLHSSERVTSGEKLMIFLRVLTRTTTRACGERWQVSGATVSAAIHEVLSALRIIRPAYIQPPGTAIPAHIASSPKFFPYFSNCIGALDGACFLTMTCSERGSDSYCCVLGTHIPAIVPAASTGAFRNRKGFISQNVLAACDFDMIFCYILAGWEGSAHDGRVYSEALQDGFPRVEGRYYLADAGYSLTKDTLTPYRGVRYHLKEWSAGNQKPATKEELFNLRHASLRNVIERAFGVFKKKFPLMQSMLSYPFTTQVELVLGTTVIFNFIRRSSEPMGPLDEPDTSQLTDIDQDETECIDADTDNSAKNLRDQIATDMWSDYLVHLAGRDNSVVV